MRGLLISASLAATVLLGFGLVAADAQAAYSGTITRSLCPLSALEAKSNVGWFAGGGLEPQSNLCGLKNTAGGTIEEWVSVPYDATAAQNMQLSFAVHGAGTLGQQLCAQAHAYDQDGNLVTTSVRQCSVGSSGIVAQPLPTMYLIGVPAFSAVITRVWADYNTSLDMVSMTFLSQG